MKLDDFFIPQRQNITTEELLEAYPDLAELYNKYLTFEILKREPEPESKRYSKLEELRKLIDGMK